MLSNTDLRISLAEQFSIYEDRGLKLFHLTVTFKRKTKYELSIDIVNKYFRTWYMSRFLPMIMKTRNYHKESVKKLQPIVYSFPDSHKLRSIESEIIKLDKLKITQHKNGLVDKEVILEVNSASLDHARDIHYHSIVASRNYTKSILEELSERSLLKKNLNNDLSLHFGQIESIEINECPCNILMYASKKYDFYPHDFMTFPDKFYQTNNMKLLEKKMSGNTYHQMVTKRYTKSLMNK
jgi:hypothetical protein